jgi:hypothetical protein
MKKNTAKETLAKVQDFIDRMKAADYSVQQPRRRQKEHRQAKRETMDDLMKEIDEFDRSLGPGLKVGRLVSWPQGDGHALYFVIGIGRQVVQLAWLPWVDCWHSPVVVNGQALRPAVELAIKAKDGLRDIFSAKAVKPNPPDK